MKKGFQGFNGGRKGVEGMRESPSGHRWMGGGEEAGSGPKVDVMDRNEGNCWLKRLGGGE
jgi:hypothetical protein